jgi:hypothetical protein
MRSLFVIVLAVILFSCGKDDDPGPANNTASFLKVGTKYTFFFNDNMFYEDSIKTVIEKELAPDTFLVRNYSESIATAPTQYWVLKDNNFYVSFRLRDPSTYQIECKFGQPVGTTWTVNKANTNFTYKIEALDVSITTGEGVVNDAIKVSVKAPNGQQHLQYISPTVGMLGNGSINENVTTKLYNYTIGSSTTTTNSIPKITFGNFPFLAVGKYWNYRESDIIGDEKDVNILVESKLPNQNIFKIKMTYAGEISYSYWYEDNGLLMVYEGNETLLNADPIYMNESIAKVGYGWMGVAPSGMTFIYEIVKLNESTDSFFGELPCMEIEVTQGLFSSQSNFWHKSKGNVLVSGWVSRDVVGSNVRSTNQKPFIPILSL